MAQIEHTKNTIKSFKDLIVWQQGHELVIMIYKLTRDFPAREIYSLVDQMRRAASSVTSNIAEGFGRQTYKEKKQFYYIARGSLTELENQVILSKDINYLDIKKFDDLEERILSVRRLLQGLINKSRTFMRI